MMRLKVLVRLVDTVNRELVLAGEKPTDGMRIKLDNILEIYGEAFDRVFGTVE